MANQPLAFAELLAGGVLTAAALSGSSVRDVLTGKAGPFRGFATALSGAGQATTTGNASNASDASLGGIYSKKNLGRVDQGVDFTGKGDVVALAPGKITHVDTRSGWPGGTLITLALDTPVKIGNAVYKYIYIAENIAPTVHVGQKVAAGDVIGQARGTSPYTEQGFADSPQGTTYARTHGGYTEGQQTQAGKDFLAWLGL